MNPLSRPEFANVDYGTWPWANERSAGLKPQNALTISGKSACTSRLVTGPACGSTAGCGALLWISADWRQPPRSTAPLSARSHGGEVGGLRL